MSPSYQPPKRVHAGRKGAQRSSFFSRHKVLIYISSVVVTSVTLYTSLSFASHSEFLRIKEVTLSGTKLVRENDVQDLIYKIRAQTRLGSISNNTVYTLPIERIRSAILETYTAVASVEFERSYVSNTVHVAIVEHEIYAIWCAQGSESCYYITSGGYIFGPALYDPAFIRWYSEAPTDPLRASIGGEFFNNAKLLVDGIQAKTGNVLKVELSPDNKELRVYVNSWYIRTRTDVNPHDSLRYIIAGLSSKDITALGEQLEYMDVRFGNRIFYKEKYTEQYDDKLLDEAP